MKMGYVLLYVESVEKTVEFYEKAFGLSLRFLHESKDYAEMDTGASKLGFVSIGLAAENVAFERVTQNAKPPGIEIGFVSTDVTRDFGRALEAGAVAVLEPTKKPWGQVVSYVRDLNGFLVEICS